MPPLPTDIVAAHPRLSGLGQTPAARALVAAFARDLAAWLVGHRDNLGTLARVITVVAARELHAARTLCHGVPLLAVEAAARAVEALWPWLQHARVGRDAPSAIAQAARAAEDGALESDVLVRQLETLLPGVGWSTAPEALHASLLDRLTTLSALITRLDTLTELANSLGRWQGEADAGGDRGGRDEVVGVHLSGEVADALPSELALLADPATEDLFYQRLTEHRLLSLELTGAATGGVRGGDRRGPVIACVDTSGSMTGAPELAAKALVLAVCRAVLPEGRPVHLLLFSGPGDRTELRLRAGHGGLEELLDFLGRTFGGGTDFDTPLLSALALLDEEDLSRADLLVVTDGLARATPEVVAAVARARGERGVRVWSTVIGVDTAGVDAFSDHVRLLTPSAVRDLLDAIVR